MNVHNPDLGSYTRMQSFHMYWQDVVLHCSLTLPADCAPRWGFNNMTAPGGPVTTSTWENLDVNHGNSQAPLIRKTRLQSRSITADHFDIIGKADCMNPFHRMCTGCYEKHCYQKAPATPDYEWYLTANLNSKHGFWMSLTFKGNA